MPNQGLGLYRDQGIVLRAIRLGEADRIVTIYTQSQGRVRAVAKGARKSKSRFGGRLDAFTHVDLQLYAGRGDLDIVSQAEIIARYPRLRSDYAAFCAAAAMADTIERTALERERNLRLFVLFRGGLQALEEGAADPPLLAYAFLAKAMSLGGMHPMLQVCVGCGSVQRGAFSFGDGGAVCPGCAGRADPKASEGALEGWDVLLEGAWEDLRALSLAPQVRRELSGLLLGFVQWQTDSRLRAFGLLAAM